MANVVDGGMERKGSWWTDKLGTVGEGQAEKVGEWGAVTSADSEATWASNSEL